MMMMMMMMMILIMSMAMVMLMVMIMMVMMMTSGDDSHAGYTVVGIHYQHAIHQSPTLSVHSTSNQTKAMLSEPPSVLIDGG